MFGFSRAELFAFCFALAALNRLSQRASFAIVRLGWGDAAWDLYGISAIFWIAIFAMARIALDDPERHPPDRADRADRAVAGFATVFLLLPSHTVAVAVLRASAAWLALRSRAGTAERRIAIIGLALTAPLLWGPLILGLAGEELLALDGSFVSLLSGLPHDGNIVGEAGRGGSIMITQGCSSLTNVPLALLLVVAAAQLFQLPYGRTMIWTSVASVLGVIAVNGGRLTMIVLHPDQYKYLHNGIGSAWFGWGTLLVLLATVGTGLVHAARTGD